jgi:hypothetical protein
MSEVSPWRLIRSRDFYDDSLPPYDLRGETTPRRKRFRERRMRRESTGQSVPQRQARGQAEEQAGPARGQAEEAVGPGPAEEVVHARFFWWVDRDEVYCDENGFACRRHALDLDDYPN